MPQFRPQDLPRLSETPYFQCLYGHIFHRDHARLTVDTLGTAISCPTCAVETINPLPDAVLQSMRSFAKNHDTTFENLMVGMSYDNLNRCYHFPFASMIMGVEIDGHIHS